VTVCGVTTLDGGSTTPTAMSNIGQTREPY
jgi:hypothetical protein